MFTLSSICNIRNPQCDAEAWRAWRDPGTAATMQTQGEATMQCAARLTVLSMLIGATASHAAGAESNAAGPSVASQDAPFTFKLGGRVMWDADSYDGAQSADGNRRFNTELRRARLETSGTLLTDFSYVFDVNINDQSADKDAEVFAAGLKYTGWRHVDLFIGRDKEPFGLEEMTSSKAISSIERNYFTDATDADAQPHFGVRLDGKSGPLGWSVGAFNPNGNPQDSDGSDRYALTGRVFGAPLLDGDRVLHLGAGYTDRRLDEAQPAAGFGIRVAKTGDRLGSREIVIDDDRQAGIEVLFLNGPWSLQGEAFRRDMTGAAGGPDGVVRHYYLQATWTVTGETRGYRAGQGIPGIIVPEGPRGALELVAKIDDIEFDVDGEADQTVSGYLIGANWYANKHVKVMLNVIRVNTDEIVESGLDDDATVIAARLQVAI
jgi:phosphate-selective porin OprO and OprP